MIFCQNLLIMELNRKLAAPNKINPIQGNTGNQPSKKNLLNGLLIIMSLNFRLAFIDKSGISKR